jgi:hypothetical protein
VITTMRARPASGERAISSGQNDQDGEQRERDHPVGETHQNGIETAAEIAGYDTEHAADRRRNDGRGQPDDDRHAPAVEQPCQEIAAEIVGPERMRGRGAGEPVQEIGLGRIDPGERQDPGCGEAGERQRRPEGRDGGEGRARDAHPSRPSLPSSAIRGSSAA